MIVIMVATDASHSSKSFHMYGAMIVGLFLIEIVVFLHFGFESLAYMYMYV